MATGIEYLQGPTKRLHDLTAVSIALPAIFAVWPTLRHYSKRFCDQNGSPLVKENRCGQYDQQFVLRKFRTTLESAFERSRLPDVIDENSSAIGNAIRIIGLDEAPQVFNVVNGNMAMIGPRPLTHNDLDQMYSRVQDRGLANDWIEARYLIRPGLIGPGQFYVHRNLSFSTSALDEQMRIDVEYAQNANLAHDIKFMGRAISEPLYLGRLAYQETVANSA